MKKVRMVVTDLDGTLLNSKGEVSETDKATLINLGEQGVVRVVATGRSPYSFSRVIPADFPIDYLVFSSGGGAMGWEKKDLLYTKEMSVDDINAVVRELVAHNVDFMVHESYPTNHRFLYYQHSEYNTDFEQRLLNYESHGRPLTPVISFDTPMTQVIAILPNDPEWFQCLKKEFPSLKVIRATSPLDGRSIWMEIFPMGVSKAYGIQWICSNLSIDADEVIAVGNDFNDLDMLGAIPQSYVVSNAPEELRSQFKSVRSNDESGFTQAVEGCFIG